MKSKFINSIINDNGVGRNNESNRLTWIEQTLSELPTGSRILDAGAGELAQKKFCKHLDYVSQDFAQYHGNGNGKGFHTGSWDTNKVDIICDITNIPEPDGCFDAIMCVEVFEHLPNPIEAIKEFKRLLRKGGYLILTAPFCSLTHFAPYHFYSGFNRYFFETHLSLYGFSIIELSSNGNYFEYMAQELRRVSSCVEEYTEESFSAADKLAVKHLLKSMSKFSNADQKSNEILNFGFHVLARVD